MPAPAMTWTSDRRRAGGNVPTATEVTASGSALPCLSGGLTSYPRCVPAGHLEGEQQGQRRSCSLGSQRSLQILESAREGSSVDEGEVRSQSRR